MVSAATKRKRRVRGNRIAEAVEDARERACADRKTLGTPINASIPDHKLFTVDRQGQTKTQVQQELYEQAAEQRRAAKRARRTNPKVRKSEAASIRQDTGVRGGNVGKKKKEVGKVEKDILAKRKFDKPVGHVGNLSEGVRLEKVYRDGKEDVWMGDMSAVVAKEIGQNRKRLVKKMNEAQRSAASVVHPTVGLSINPTHEDHQDKLGEALANIVHEDDDKKWDAEKMSYDPALLEESREGEIADTGMKVDNDEENESESEEDEHEYMPRAVPERKTRSQRHKEARKREMASNIAKKRTTARRTKDFDNIDLVAEEAKRIADKVSGEEKLRRLEQNPPPPKQADHPVVDRIAGQKVRNETIVEPVTFSTELSEAMRNVKMPVANPMLRDRFLSFERRGLIEPPKVLPKEIWRMEQEKRQELMRDKRKRKGRGSRSNLTFWRNGKRVVQ